LEHKNNKSGKTFVPLLYLQFFNMIHCFLAKEYTHIAPNNNKININIAPNNNKNSIIIAPINKKYYLCILQKSLIKYTL
jgi:hypothetical protein